MPNLGISLHSIPQEMNLLVASGARLRGKLLVNGRHFLVRHAPDRTRFIDIPACRQPEWADYLQSELRSTTATQLETGYAQALATVSQGEIAPVDKEALSHVIFSGADFSAAVFRGADFSGLDLKGANLQGARFENCVFNDTDLSRSNLTRCAFVDCKFDEATIHYASMQATAFESCSMNSTFLGGSNLTAARFNLCHITAGSFEETLLENAHLSDCYMKFVGFGYADARGARFSRINLVMPEGVTLPDRNRGKVAHFDLLFPETILHNAVFEWCDLEECYLTTMRGDKLTIADCYIYMCDFPWKRTELIREVRGCASTLAQIYQRRHGGMLPPAPVPAVPRQAQALPQHSPAPATAQPAAPLHIDQQPQASHPAAMPQENPGPAAPAPASSASSSPASSPGSPPKSPLLVPRIAPLSRPYIPEPRPPTPPRNRG